jgi:predicted Mrr-cat superfamily restriction endonuclease
MDYSRFVKIYDVPSNQRYWVVRANTGKYLTNFLQGKCIAIGHLDHLKFPEAKQFHESEYEKIAARLAVQLKEGSKSKAHISSVSNQIYKFLFDMKPGDLVLTPAYGRIILGRITGVPRISNEVISVEYDAKRKKPLIWNTN